uniref:WAP domain-containing protein n=1 Tax=Nothoprocta perdicaria TaxID=30464 RepID=A0A8C6ZNN8_NOTPE
RKAHAMAVEKGSAWSCPKVQITCAMVNPPNHCFMDQHCPRFKKCCPTFCGRRCISRPPEQQEIGR